MDEARAIDEWQRASFVAAYAANSNPNLRRPVRSTQINPIKLKSGGMRVTRDNFQDLKLICQVSDST